jgi:hypothetical protein
MLSKLLFNLLIHREFANPFPAKLIMEVEVILLKRTLIFVFVLLILALVPIHNVYSYNAIDALSNKTLNSEIAVKNGNIVMITYTDGVSRKTHNNNEIYNIDRLDDFMKNIDIGKKDKIRIAEYGKNVTGTWANKLFDLKYNGKKIIYIEYDTYSNPNEFLPGKPEIFNRIIKRDYPDGIAYRICNSGNENSNCGKLISFGKSSIVNSKR